MTEKESALDVQVGGDHYKRFKIQPIEFIHANKIGYIEGNVIKYICRHDFKDGVKDLEKIKHFIDLLIELEYSREEKVNLSCAICSEQSKSELKQWVATVSGREIAVCSDCYKVNSEIKENN